MSPSSSTHTSGGWGQIIEVTKVLTQWKWLWSLVLHAKHSPSKPPCNGLNKNIKCHRQNGHHIWLQIIKSGRQKIGSQPGSEKLFGGFLCFCLTTLVLVHYESVPVFVSTFGVRYNILFGNQASIHKWNKWAVKPGDWKCLQWLLVFPRDLIKSSYRWEYMG